MKFKIGDKVRVKKDLVDCEDYGGVIFFEVMRCDEIREINRELTDGNSTSFYQIEEFGYWYSAEMLELVSEGNKPTNKEIEKLYEVE